MTSAKELLQRWLDAWRHESQIGESPSRLASETAEFLVGQPEQDDHVGNLTMWGSECTECGNATPESMTCDTCCSDEHTVVLWIADSKKKETITDHGKPRHHSA